MDSIELLNKLAGRFDQPCRITTKDGEEYRGIFSATHHDGFGHVMVVLTNKSMVEEFAHTDIKDMSMG